MSAAVNPLANPKGGKKLCELCHKPAYLQCTKCGVTFYCDIAHQEADWLSIHNRVCQMLVPVRTPTPFHNLQTERDHHRAEIRKAQEQLISMSEEEARRWLFEGRCQEALPAARLCLRIAMETHGPNAVQLVPAYLLLAEANVGLGSPSLAEEYLSQAEWTVLKTPDCSGVLRHRLHRNLGSLYSTTDNPDAALQHYANDVYYASEQYGLDSIVTCGGYFLMASVFQKQNKMDIVNSLYSKVADSWHGHLSKLMENRMKLSVHQTLSEVERCEGDRTLTSMLEQQEEMNTDSALNQFNSAQLLHCLSMLWSLAGSWTKALQFGHRALVESQRVKDHSLTGPIQELLTWAQAQHTHTH
ncbi:zinc finger MYND domain-containing protein 12 [Clupea harengus]|uniref:Zinc finger MYND domain-containing protein 12 n=1 Tax=Clupea harengus TaxID=7950 RepID=A0A6P8FHK9_CLUHA|nr:zinc finger MYND domain-containing protein 12 [Clupea harengus]